MNAYEIIKKRNVTDAIPQYVKGNENNIVVYMLQQQYFYCASYHCIPSSIQVNEVESYMQEYLHKEKEEVIYYALIEEEKSVEQIRVQSISYKQEREFNQFKEICGKDIEIANVDIYDPYVLGYYEDTLVGVCSAQEIEGYYDIAIVVHPHHRNKGIATTLLTAMATKLQKDKKEILYKVEENNQASISLMKKIGFKVILKECIYK